jgi:erythromycin esterase-like protein
VSNVCRRVEGSLSFSHLLGCGRGEHNLGQLVRERYGEEACLLVGLSSYQGTVMAGSKWGAPMQVRRKMREEHTRILLDREQAEGRRSGNLCDTVCFAWRDTYRVCYELI